MAEGPSIDIGAEVNSSGALLVSCFPSVGFVSSIVAHFLVERLELELVGGPSSESTSRMPSSGRKTSFQLGSMQVSQYATWTSATRWCSSLLRSKFLQN